MKNQSSILNNLGAVILAGGRSSRFHLNKVFLEIGGEPLVKHVVTAASKVTKDIVLTIGIDDREEDFRRVIPSWVKIAKDTSTKKAPILGALTGLESITSNYAAILASDMPFVSSDVVRQLHDEAHGFNLAIPYWSNGNIEPLYAVYDVGNAITVFRETIAHSDLRMHHAIKRLTSINYVPVENFRNTDPLLICFVNINLPTDLGLVHRILHDTQVRFGREDIQNPFGSEMVPDGTSWPDRNRSSDSYSFSRSCLGKGTVLACP